MYRTVACTGGARAPAPLRSDAKVPLLSGLCYMNDIVDDKNQYRHSLYAEYVYVGHQLVGGGGGGTIPVAKKKKKKNPGRAIPGSLRLNSDAHN